MKKWTDKILSAVLLGALLSAASMPAAVLAEAVEPSEAAQEAEEGTLVIPDAETELKDGIFTIRLKGEKENNGFSWSFYEEESPLELLTQTNEEKDLCYAGSFRAREDAPDGSGLIRLAHSDGTHSDCVMEFELKIESGRITEETGGGISYPADLAVLSLLLAGSWRGEADASVTMELSPAKNQGLSALIVFGDEKTPDYHFTAYYDVIEEGLIYADGGEAAGEDAKALESQEAEKGSLVMNFGSEESVDSLDWIRGKEGESLRFLPEKGEE